MAPASAKPIYVLYGTDSFLRDEARGRIIAELLDGADPQVCIASFDSDAEPVEVFDELRTLPFLAPRRVVIVRDADDFVSRNRDALEKYIQTPAPSGSLILFVSSWASNTRLYKVVARVGQAVDCSEPDARDLPRWIIQSAARRGKKIAPDAAGLLAEWIGPDLAVLDGEMEKLSLFVGERPEIAAEDVSALVAATTGPGPFDLTNAITAGNVKDALTALGGMMTKRGEEFRILGLIASHLRRALLAQQLRVSGKDPESILPYNIPYPAKRAFLDMLARRPPRKLHADFRKLLRADLGMKSGAEPLAAMQDLVLALCS